MGRKVFRMFVRLLFLGLLVGFIGCTPKSDAPKKNSSIESEDRPPLKVLLVGNANISEAIETRWKGFSSQRLTIEVSSESAFLALEKCRNDVILFPSRLLPDVVEKDWISPLTGKRAEAEEKHGWHHHWMRTAQYGKTYWGIPLGVAIPSVLLREASDNRAPVYDLSSLPTVEVPMPNEELSAEQCNAIIDRFLMYIASQQQVSANLSIFFQPLEMRNRLFDPNIMKHIMEFAKEAKKNPSLFSSHESAWQMVRNGKAIWSIGYPNCAEETPEISESEIQSYTAGLLDEIGMKEGSGVFGKVLVDAGNGWLACRSRATRQSAVSNMFIEWLDQEEQRESFCLKTNHIIPRVVGIGVQSTTRPDTVPYYRLASDAWNQGTVLQELRLRGSNRYRKSLATTILSIAKDPANGTVLLKQCSQDWEKITEELGRDRQRQSLERGLQLLEVSNR